MARTTIEFSNAAASELERLTNKLGGSKADVMRNALSLYSYIVTLLQQPGRALSIMNENETDPARRVEKVILVPGLSPAVAQVPEEHVTANAR